MSYPRPIQGESADRLYRQACFFWDEYERVKTDAKRLRAALVALTDPEGHIWHGAPHGPCTGECKQVRRALKGTKS